jgi:AcrR family transcriptional regulator/DNA-binding Xre family transcriptional regulator
MFSVAERMSRAGAGLDPGAAIRRARETRGKSLRRLAAEMAVSPATLSALETGRTPITVERLQRVAQLLDLPVEMLLRGEAPAVATPHRGRGWREHSGLELDPVLEAAALVFVRRGFHAASMREVAAEAGLSVAGVYHHFASKQQILVALLDVTMAEIRWRLLAAREEGTTPTESFALMVESLALFHAVRGDLAFLGASEMRAIDEPERTRVIGLRDEVQHQLDAQADRCIANGDFTVGAPRTACRAIVTMCTSLPSWFRLSGPLAPEEVARMYADYAVAIMR